MPPNLLDSHESRLQKMESDYAQVNHSLGQISANVESLGVRWEEGNQDLKVNLNEHFGRLGQRLESTCEKVQAVTERVQVLEVKEHGRTQFRRTCKKFGLPVAVAAASVIATRFGDQILTWLHW